MDGFILMCTASLINARTYLSEINLNRGKNRGWNQSTKEKAKQIPMHSANDLLASLRNIMLELEEAKPWLQSFPFLKCSAHRLTGIAFYMLSENLATATGRHGC